MVFIWMYLVLMQLGKIINKLNVIEGKINRIGNITLQQGYIINDISDAVDNNSKMIDDLYGELMY